MRPEAAGFMDRGAASGCSAPSVVIVKGGHVRPNARRRGLANTITGGDNMLAWALIFFIVAIIAGVLGFAGIAGTAAWIAKTLFVVFLVLFVIMLVTGRSARR
jgi:uncharacterized membrane protein YtjA (UPF0391 family)